MTVAKAIIAIRPFIHLGKLSSDIAGLLQHTLNAAFRYRLALPEIDNDGMGGTLLSPALQGQQCCGWGHNRLLCWLMVVGGEQ
tara:strand:+ start:173 stop:421 length:249 start_codon:yes stop_codon:yes gene_type:complete